MAFKIKINKRFNKNAEKVASWLEKEWSKKVADDFARKLVSTISAISKNPFIGSSTPKIIAVRKFNVTKHNKIYYRIKNNTITFITIFDNRQNPKKNRYK
ncbi:MAG: type II toxin-antitoxin system RelE/ParE family toxin [Chitinophagaceae bacterium]|nr:type II toxin-antitoxin system RelE/ParE family toxin [Chitinophagaceae bacterium]